MKKLILFLFLSTSVIAGESVVDIMEILKTVESENNTEVIGDDGKAVGILQIHKIAVRECNRLFGTSYTYEDRYDEVCSEEMFILLTNYGIARYIYKYGTYPNEAHIVRLWNFGLYQKQYNNGYYKRYLKRKREKEIKKILQGNRKRLKILCLEEENNNCYEESIQYKKC